MFTDLPVMHTDLIVRRTIVLSGALAVVALAALLLLGQPLAGLGVLLGVAAALGNHRLFQLSTVRYTTTGALQRRPFAGSVAIRLALVTAIAIALVYFARPAGFGMMGGLLLFQGALMGSALGALWRYQRLELSSDLRPSGSGSGSDGNSTDGEESDD